jgi:hypothetical protein
MEASGGRVVIEGGRTGNSRSAVFAWKTCTRGVEMSAVRMIRIVCMEIIEKNAEIPNTCPRRGQTYQGESEAIRPVKMGGACSRAYQNARTETGSPSQGMGKEGEAETKQADSGQATGGSGKARNGNGVFPTVTTVPGCNNRDGNGTGGKAGVPDTQNSRGTREGGRDQEEGRPCREE